MPGIPLLNISDVSLGKRQFSVVSLSVDCHVHFRFDGGRRVEKRSLGSPFTKSPAAIMRIGSPSVDAVYSPT